MYLKDALTFGGLTSAKVVAGDSGLSCAISSVSVLEVAEETVAAWTIENQLFITSFYAIRDDIEMQKIVIQTLAKCRCCGLVICHIERILRRIDKSVLDLCNTLGFPLIVASSETSFIEIINPIFSRLSEASASGQTMIRNDFIDLLASDKPVSDILKLLAYKAGYEISFLDIHFNCLYSNKNEMKKEQETTYLQEKLGWKSMDLSSAHYHIIDLEDQNTRTMVYYIKKSGTLFGFLCIEYKLEDSTEQVLAVADSLNVPCALLLNKSSKLSDAVYDYQQVFFSDLLVWNFRSARVAINRAWELGYTLEEKHFIAVVNINGFQGNQQKDNELTRYIKRWYLPNVEQVVKTASSDNIVHFRSDIFLILLHNPTEMNELRALMDKILSLFQGSKVTSVSIGVSNRFDDFNNIPKAYNEAFDIAILGRTLIGENRTALFSELGMFYYLKSMRDFPAVIQLCAHIIAPLRKQDESKGTELVKTARVLFESNLDVQRSAEILHIHRNTLLYRKKQIQDIVGYHVFELPYSYNFMSALFMEHIL